MSSASAAARLPEWARKGSPLAPGARALRVLLRDQALTTVCGEARAMGLPTVNSGVFVRSSFNAEEVFMDGRSFHPAS